ncbi:MAG: hypothetical protein ABJN26_28890 [Stappiaceae bacterium]
MIRTLLTCPLAGAYALLATISSAQADSCWDHNGSLMRLVAEGNQRSFYYEAPKPSLRGSGIAEGTLLFNGVKNGSRYAGTARRFSKYCPGSPLEYYVEGPVRSDQTKVTMRGPYETQRRCRPTGAIREDILIFTYKFRC